MALHNEQLYTLIQRVKAAKQSAGPEQCRQWLNDGVRNVIDRRAFWTDLMARSVISVPDVYATGTIITATGSTLVTGTATAWPTTDLVNTFLQTDITERGFAEVQLADMTNVIEDSVLLLDQGTGTEEACPVIRVGQDSISIKVMKAHNAGATVRMSSMVGRQFRPGMNYPIFTILAVPTATTLILDNPWGGPALASVGYQILKMYYSLGDSKIRRLLCAVDQRQGIPLQCRVQQGTVNVRDPQRSSTGDPILVADFTPSICGNTQVEIWPAPTSARQISYLCTKQWPEMIEMTDQPPPFLNPVMFVKYAQAEGLNTKINKEDAWFDPKLAQVRLAEFEALYETAANADEERSIQEWHAAVGSMLGFGGPNFWMDHEPDVMLANF